MQKMVQRSVIRKDIIIKKNNKQPKLEGMNGLSNGLDSAVKQQKKWRRVAKDVFA